MIFYYIIFALSFILLVNKIIDILFLDDMHNRLFNYFHETILQFSDNWKSEIPIIKDDKVICLDTIKQEPGCSTAAETKRSNEQAFIDPNKAIYVASQPVYTSQPFICNAGQSYGYSPIRK